MKQITYEERKKIEVLCKDWTPVKKIADEMGLTIGRVYDELRRGGAGNGKRCEYSAEKAQRAMI